MTSPYLALPIHAQALIDSLPPPRDEAADADYQCRRLGWRIKAALDGIRMDRARGAPVSARRTTTFMEIDLHRWRHFNRLRWQLRRRADG